MKKPLVFVSIALVCLAFAASDMQLKINGKNVPNGLLVVEGKSYVAVGALREAGAKVAVADGVVSIDFVPPGGAGQQNGVEGKVGDWLFNGIWRFRVVSVSKQSDPNGWKVDVEIKNGTNSNGYAPGGTGWQGVTLVLSDGTVVPSRSDSPELRDSPVNQAAGNQQTLYFDTESASEPDRLILRFDPKGTEGTPLKFTVADPTFRVNLKDKK